MTFTNSSFINPKVTVTITLTKPKLTLTNPKLTLTLTLNLKLAVLKKTSRQNTDIYGKLCDDTALPASLFFVLACTHMCKQINNSQSVGINLI